MSHATSDVDPGHPDRFWFGDVNKSATKPLRIELRHKWDSARNRPADPKWARLIGYGTCAADDESVAAEKRRILQVAGDLDKYTGVHE